MSSANRKTYDDQFIFIRDDEKEILVERYSDLKFEDDVSDWSCKRCGRVLIHHYVHANCGHLFCRNCQRVLTNEAGWRCPQCREYITNMVEQKVQVEERVYGLAVHCLNHKYGCKLIMPLRQIPMHLKACVETREANLPKLLDFNPFSLKTEMNNIRAMCETMSYQMTTVMESQRQTPDDLIRKLKEMQDKHSLEKELIKNETERRMNEMISDFNFLKGQINDNRSEIMKEINARWSKMEEILNKYENSERMDDSRKKLDEIEENVTTKLTEDYRHKMDEIEEKFDRRSNELSSNLAESGIQQNAIKASLIEKLEEMDNKLTQDFQNKLDQLSAKMPIQK